MTTKGGKKTSHWLLALASVFFAGKALALGTASNTVIRNDVSVDFLIGGVSQTPASDSVQFRVDNKVDLSIAVTGDTVSPSQGNRVLTFVIRNDGNTTQGYQLMLSNSSIADQFDMNNVRIYVESNGTAGWQAGDTLYTSGVGVTAGNAGNVAADATLTIYVVADVPPTGGGSTPANAATARYDLLVTTLNAGSTTATASSSAAAWDPNTVQAVLAEGSAGPHSNDGNNDGKLSASATYSVNAPAVNFVKSATVTDTLGGNQPYTGATITYSLQVSVSGTGNVDSIVFSDAIPANTTYVANSLRLNSGALTDAADADAGNFNVSSANAVTVNLGTLNSGSGTQTITFAVTIN